VDINPAFGERERNPPSPHAEFEYGSGASVFCEESDGSLCIERKELDPLVVNVGKAVAVTRQSVLLDGPDTTPRSHRPNKRPAAAGRQFRL
jgi:hypothetical protein